MEKLRHAYKAMAYHLLTKRFLVDSFRKIVVMALSTSLVALPASPMGAATLPEDYSLPGKHVTGDARIAPAPTFDRADVEPIIEVIEGAAFVISDRFAVSGFSIPELLDSLDYEAEQAFRFVRDNIDFVPYHGVLRGAAGTLGARSGNAWDRSLLLKRLLQDMGFDARLVRGILQEEARARLDKEALVRRSSGMDIAPLAALVGLGPEMRQRMLSRAERDYAWLSGALSGHVRRSVAAGPRLPSLHVWVQAKLDGEWKDMDTVFSDSEIGTAYAEAEAYPGEPPPAAIQSVDVAVVAEVLDNGSLDERVLLDTKLEARSLSERRLYLTFAPRNPTMGGVLAQALGNELQYMPLLSVDGEMTKGDYVPAVRGSITEGEMFFYGEEQSQLTALYLDVTTGGAGQEQRSSRKILLDRLPASARVGEHAQLRRDMVEQLEIHDRSPLVFQSVHQLTISNGGSNPYDVARRVGLGLYFHRKHLLGGDDLEKLPVDSIMWPLAKIREGQIAVNERLLMSSLNDKPGIRFFIGSPRVYVFSHNVERTGDATRISETIDLLHDPLHVTTTGGNADVAGVFERRLWHGVLQASFETTLSELPAVTQPDELSRILSASTEVSGNPVVIERLNDLQRPSELPATARSQLKRGALLVLGQAALSRGIRTWWSVDPDGTTKAMLSPDLGGSYGWWDPLTNSRLPKQSVVNPRVHRIASVEAHDQYARAAAKRQAQVARSKNLPKTAGSCRSGGNEYLVTQCAGTFIVVPGGAAIALTVVAGAFVGLLYMVGYVVINEYQHGRL